MKKVEFFVEMLPAGAKDWHRVSADPQPRTEREARGFLAECKQDATEDGVVCQYRIIKVTTEQEALETQYTADHSK